MNDFILGINPCVWGLNYHNPSVVLYENGEISYAIEEERLNRIKNSKGMFPSMGIQEVKDYLSSNNQIIKEVVVCCDPKEWKKRIAFDIEKLIAELVKMKEKVELENDLKKEDYERYDYLSQQLDDKMQQVIDVDDIEKAIGMLISDKKINIVFVEHHLCHAISSYYYSGFKRALAFVIDGVGEYASTTVWKIEGNTYDKIHTLPIPNSLGYLYALFTAYCGFEPWCEEGKLMALAPYGKYNKKISAKLDSLIKYKDETYKVSELFINAIERGLYLNVEKAICNLELILNHPRREKADFIDDYYKDVAWYAQSVIENIVNTMVSYWIKETGIASICLAGGVFMNCKLNMTVRDNPNVKKIFVQPVSGDAGCSLGAALYNKDTNHRLTSLALGNDYSNEEILIKIKNYDVKYTKMDENDLLRLTAQNLADGKIICWFYGKSEFGARALGNRSLIMDPRDRENSDILNSRIKHRERWRPFACSVMEEHADEILENYNGKSFPLFMIEAFKVKDNWVNKIPAVVHFADGTTRPQIVCKRYYERYHKLISFFYEITGIPLIMNTSFNDKGDPIVNSPQNALDFFINSKADILVIGDYFVTRE